jgi:hypothetical protein
MHTFARRFGLINRRYGQQHRKGRALSGAFALGADSPAVKLYQMAHD